MHTPLYLPLLPNHGSLCAGRYCVRKSSTAAGLPQWDRGDSANGSVRGRHTGRSGKQGNPSIGNSFIPEKMTSMKKCNTSPFCTLILYCQQAPCTGYTSWAVLCSNCIAQCSDGTRNRESWERPRNREVSERENPISSRRPLSPSTSFLSARGEITLPVWQEGRCSHWCKPQAVVAQH